MDKYIISRCFFVVIFCCFLLLRLNFQHTIFASDHLKLMKTLLAEQISEIPPPPPPQKKKKKKKRERKKY